MINKLKRDKRILDVLKNTIEEGMTCEEIFRELCRRSEKNGVKSIKSLSKILQRFPLIKSKKMLISNKSLGIQICSYVTLYRLEKDWKNKVSPSLLTSGVS